MAEDRKDEARAALAPALAEGFGSRLVAIRLNASDSPHHGPDLAALHGLKPDFVVLPKVEAAGQVADLHHVSGLPVIAMILGMLHVPPEGLALIFGVDRILDMCRTTLNVVGDLVIATCVASGEGTLEADAVPATE